MPSLLRRPRWTVHSMQVHELAESLQSVYSMQVQDSATHSMQRYADAWILLRSHADSA